MADGYSKYRRRPIRASRRRRPASRRSSTWRGDPKGAAITRPLVKGKADKGATKAAEERRKKQREYEKKRKRRGLDDFDMDMPSPRAKKARKGLGRALAARRKK